MDNNAYDPNIYGPDETRRKLVLFGTIGLGALILLALVVFLVTTHKRSQSGASDGRTADVTTITSPLTKSSDQLTVSYGGDASPNLDAVQQPFRIFSVDTLPVPQGVQKALSELVPPLVRQQVTPTYPSTYIQVEKSSIHCDSSNNCTMNIYIDSPETYFALNLSKVNGIYAPHLTQIAWKGIRQ